MTVLENEKEIVDNYKKLQRARRDSKKSIIHMSNGKLLTSIVYTDPAFAKRIIDHFMPNMGKGLHLDPCRGVGAFYNNLPENNRDWCEIQEGKDFLDYEKKVGTIWMNLPWRGSNYTALSNKALSISDNVISLCKLSTALGTTKRFNDALKHNMFLKEVHFVSWKDANFTFIDGSPKAAEGFILAVLWWQKEHKGGTQWKQGEI